MEAVVVAVVVAVVIVVVGHFFSVARSPRSARSQWPHISLYANLNASCEVQNKVSYPFICVIDLFLGLSFWTEFIWV